LQRGYGFIIQRGLPVDIFFHRSDFLGETADLHDGVAVTYSLEKSGTGRLTAKSVRLA
jgi:cold shock CspA family protein